MASERTTLTAAQLLVVALATLLWVGTSLAVAGVVKVSASVTAVNLGVPFLALLFAYYVFFHERDREWATTVASVLAVTGVVGLIAVILEQATLTFAANVLALLAMLGLVAFLWRY